MNDEKQWILRQARYVIDTIRTPEYQHAKELVHSIEQSKNEIRGYCKKNNRKRLVFGNQQIGKYRVIFKIIKRKRVFVPKRLRHQFYINEEAWMPEFFGPGDDLGDAVELLL